MKNQPILCTTYSVHTQTIRFKKGSKIQRTIRMHKYSSLSFVAIIIIVFGTIVSAANFQNTTMTWVVASSNSISVAYGSPCTTIAFFFVESNAEHDNDSDGNWARAVPQSTRSGAGDTNCQTSTQAAFVVSNNGNVTVNVDGNFTTAMTGADINLELKIWQGSSGCGTRGLGGWEEPCSVTSTTAAPNTTTCKEFSSGSGIDTEGTRLITALAQFGNTQLCVSGDLNAPTGGVSSGDHNKTFVIGSAFS